MTHVRSLIATIACLVAAAVLGWRTIAHPPPKKDQLMKIEGVVREVVTATRQSRSGGGSYPVIRIEGRIGSYTYLDWFPEPQRIYDLKPGDRVRLLSDTPDGNRWVWQLEKDGRLVVGYDEVLAAVRANQRYDPLLAIGLGIAGIAGLYFFVRSLRKEPNKALEPTPGSVTPRAIESKSK